MQHPRKHCGVNSSWGGLCLYKIKALDIVEVSVSREEIRSGCNRGGCNPNVICRYWSAALPQRPICLRVDFACFGRNGCSSTAGFERKSTKARRFASPCFVAATPARYSPATVGTITILSYERSEEANASGFCRKGMRMFVSRTTRFISTSPRRFSRNRAAPPEVPPLRLQ